MAVPRMNNKSKIGGGKPKVNPLTNEAEQSPPVSPIKDLEPAAYAAYLNRGAVAPQADVMTMPIPSSGGTGPMTDSEKEQLQVCESALEELRLAFARSGRALEIVREGRLYRGEYTNFDDYVEQRWGIQRSYANKLIRAWPLASKLHPHAPALNEGQVRELLPVAAQHGDDAAVLVYQTVAGTEGIKVTASTLRDVVGILPEEFDDETTVVERIRGWLRGDFSVNHGGKHLGVFEAAESRIDALTKKVVKKRTEDPDGARAFAAKLRGLAEQIEQGLN